VKCTVLSFYPQPVRIPHEEDDNRTEVRINGPFAATTFRSGPLPPATLSGNDQVFQSQPMHIYFIEGNYSQINCL